ncbi:MAG: DUF4160 domain-containing protein [Thermoanaerobaculia bacterium]
MPTVLRIGPYRFFFFSNEGDEPAHIHVQRDRALAKFWLEPVALAQSSHFPAHELGILRNHVVENRAKLIAAWHEYFAR